MKENYIYKLMAKLCLSLAILLFFSFSAFAQNGATVTGKITSLFKQAEKNEATVSSSTIERPTGKETIYYERKPVDGATVTLKVKNADEVLFTTTTDANGVYKFENVPPGQYWLTASKSNFEGCCGQPENRRDSREVSLKAREVETQNLDLYVQFAIGSLPRNYEVVVIASGTSEYLDFETSKSVSIVKNRELENRNEISITDALRTVPGLRVQQSGGFGRIATIKTRGLRNQDTAVLIDGQRFRDAAAITGDASPFLSDLTVTSVERVEVLRGSGSSLYGTNAIGGVFNVQTDNFQRDFRSNLLAEGGGLGQFRGRANFGGGLSDKAFYNFGLSHTNFTKGVDGDDAARNTSGKAALRFNFSQYAQLTGRFYFSDAFVQLNSSPDIIGTLPATGIVEARPLSRDELRRYENGTLVNQLNVGNATFIPDANDPDNSQASRFYNFNVALDGLINQFATYKVSYQNLNTSRINRNGPAGVRPNSFFAQPNGNTRSDNDGNIQTLQAKSDIVLRSNTLTIGYEFEREKFGNDNFLLSSATVGNFVDSVQTSNTLFVQDQIEAFDKRLQLSGAFRAQFFDLKTPEFSANSPYRNATLGDIPNSYTFDGSAAYFFRSTGTKLRAHVGNGYRVPSLYERFGSSFSSFGRSFTPFGDPELEPERSIAFDGGIDQTFSSNKVRLSATYFYTRLIDTIGFLSSPRLINGVSRPFGGYDNTKGGISRGGEFSAEFAPTNTTNIFTSYTFTKSQQRQPQFGTIETLGVPTHQFSIVATQRLFDRLRLNFDFVATSSYLAPIFQNYGSFASRAYRFEGLRKGDLTASYEIPTSNDKLRVRLFGTIDNIFNQDYYENGFRTARITGRGGLQLSF